MIQVVTGDPRPIFKQIVDGIRLKIASGEMPPGTRLPSVRALAMQITVNVNTVAKAYLELTADGLIESQKGVGVFVCEPRQRRSDPERQRLLDEAVAHFVSDVIPLGFTPAEVVDRLNRELEPLTNRRTKEPGE